MNKEKEDTHCRHFSVEMDNVEMVIADMESQFDAALSQQQKRLILNLVNHYAGDCSGNWVQIIRSLVADTIF